MKRAARIAAATSLTMVMMTSGTGVASAAAPVKHACFGESVSINAAAGRGAFGAIVSGYAYAHGGVGQDVQNVQAGLVDDADFPNTCN